MIVYSLRLIVKIIRYYMFAASSLTIIIALPIPHMKVTNKNTAQGEQFVENLIQGKKLSEKPGYLVFTAPYKLCEGDCSDQGDNFAMVFPLYVGKKGQEQYKNIYTRDFLKIHHTKSNAPFKKRLSRNPFTPCRTETTTDETTTTDPLTETYSSTVEQSTTPTTITFSTTTESNTATDNNISTLTTQPTTVFEIVTSIPTIGQTPSSITVPTANFKTESITPTTEEISSPTTEENTNMKTESLTQTTDSVTILVTKRPTSTTILITDTSVPTTTKMTTPTTELITNFNKGILITETALNFVTETLIPTTTETITAPNELITKLKTRSSTPITTHTTYFVTDTSTPSVEINIISTELSTIFYTNIITLLTEIATNFVTASLMTEVKKTLTPTTQLNIGYETDTSSQNTEITSVFVTETPILTTIETLTPTNKRITKFEIKSSSIITEQTIYIGTDTSMPTIDMTILFVTDTITANTEKISMPTIELITSIDTEIPTLLTEIATNSVTVTSMSTVKKTLLPTTELNKDFETDTSKLNTEITTAVFVTETSKLINEETSMPSAILTTGLFKETLTQKIVSNTGFITETPESTAKNPPTPRIDSSAVLETKSYAPATTSILNLKLENFTLFPFTESAKPYPVIIIIYKDLTSKMPPKSISSLQTTVSRVFDETPTVVRSTKKLTTSRTYITKPDGETEIDENNAIKLPEKKNHENIVIKIIFVLIYTKEPYSQEMKLVIPGINEGISHEQANKTFLEIVIPNIYTPINTNENDYIFSSSANRLLTTTVNIFATNTNDLKKNNETKFHVKIKDTDTNMVIPEIHVNVYHEKSYSKEVEVINELVHEKITSNKPMTSKNNYNFLSNGSLEKLSTTILKPYVSKADEITKKHVTKYPKQRNDRVNLLIPEIHVNIYPENPYSTEIEVVIDGINKHIEHKKSKTIVSETVKPDIKRPIYPKISSNNPTISTADYDFWNNDSSEKLPTITLKPYVKKTDSSTITNGKNRSKYPGTESIDPEKPYYDVIEVNESGTDDHYKFTYDDNIVISDIDGSIFSENGNNEPTIAETEYMSFERLPTTFIPLESYVTNANGVRCPKPNRICVKNTSQVTEKIVFLDAIYSDSEINNNM